MDTPRLPPLDPLRGFVASARHLSFTRAATELHLTQSAISRQVQTLEQALGVRLFVRGVRTLALTPQGERLFGRAEVWLREWGELAEALRAADRRRPVTVTASIGIAALWLVPRLLDFQARHPDIDVRLAAGNRMMDLAREGIDVAIRYCADRDAPPDARRLFGESVFPVASPAVGEGLVLCAATLPRLVLLDLDDVGYPWLRWDDWLAAIGLAGARPQAVVQFNHYDQMIQAAAAGQGLAIGRAALVAPMLADGRLVAVGDARREVAGRGYWLVTAPGEVREDVGRFVSWVLRQAGESDVDQV
ncbi:MAG: LysR family transcriptional regulator [Betaproteobacteria bacterium]|nr:LysR family transcriptional regulator [Betaproteobacteria bacterium]